MRMPRLKISTGILLLGILISLLVTEMNIFTLTKVEIQKKDDKSKNAEMLNQKGVYFYQNKKYKEAIDCFKKAVLLDDSALKFFINLVRAHRDDQNYNFAERLINEKYSKFNKKRDRKKLKIELADIYSEYANNYFRLKEYPKAIIYYKKSYKINKIQRVKEAANNLNSIGFSYHMHGDLRNALIYHKKALSLWERLSNKKGAAISLHNIGAVYTYLRKYSKAEKHYKDALSLWENLDNKYYKAKTLGDMATVYWFSDESEKAIYCLRQQHSVSQENNDKSGMLQAIGSMVALYKKDGAIEEALNCQEQALSLYRESEDQYGEAITLLDLGSSYTELRYWQKAQECLKKALSFFQKNDMQEEVATVLNNLGLLFSYKMENQKALFYYNRALPIWQKLKNKTGEYLTIHNMGAAYFHLGENYKALEFHLKALQYWQKNGDREREAGALNDCGLVYLRIGQKKKALDCYKKGLKLCREVKSKTDEAVILFNLMAYWDKLNNRRLSIYWGKQAANLYLGFQERISESELLRPYFTDTKDKYRNLSHYLIGFGRLSEARQVLNLVKLEEYLDFIHGDRSFFSGFNDERLDFTKLEKNWLQKYKSVIETLATISNEHHALKFKKNKSDSEKKLLKKLELKLTKSYQSFEDFFIHLESDFEQYDKEKKEVKESVAKLEKKATALQDTLKHLEETEGGKNAVLHFLVHENSISTIITIPKRPPIIKQWQIDEQELNETVMNYITLIMKSGERLKGVELLENSSAPKKKHRDEILHKLKKYEGKLYNLTFKPVDEVLKTYGATNLTISLDGVLRYIPLGILWDGKSYLVQRYRMVLITPSSLKNIKDPPIDEQIILGFGASRGGEDFSPLPNVGREIRSIVKDEEKGYFGLIEGKGFINDEFTRAIMLSQLKTANYPIVHISSHFKFSPGDETKNKLLLGDGSAIRLSEIRHEGKLFKGVKLLVLSACETGVGGNGDEIDGFGELAQQSGAKSVIASLWPVADESTKDLMVAFYRNLKEENCSSINESLRQAQLKLAGLEDLLAKMKKGKRAKTKYSHPFYWGPFIMIGNWR